MSAFYVDINNHMSYEQSVGVVLACCKKRILHPYLRLISILGWRPLFFSAVEPPFWIQLANAIYLLFIIIIMMTGHFLEYSACHSEVRLLQLLPSLFHMGAYFGALYYSRKPESERLETLMERVFLQSAGRLICHKRLMTQLRNFFLFCLSWVLLSLSIRLMHYFWYETVYTHARMCNYDWPDMSANSAFVAIRIVCSTCNDLICAAIITTYLVHCQLNISYIKNLCNIIRERRIPLQEFFERVEESRSFIDYLNGDQSVGVSLLILHLFCRMGLAMIALLLTPPHVTFTWKASFVLTLCVLSCLSLIVVNLRQALQLTNACTSLRNIGHEIKSMRSNQSSQLTIVTTTTGAIQQQDDLDSLVLYTSSLDMEAKILKIPVRASCLSVFMISFTFLLLVLAQFGYINF